MNAFSVTVDVDRLQRLPEGEMALTDHIVDTDLCLLTCYWTCGVSGAVDVGAVG